MKHFAWISLLTILLAFGYANGTVAQTATSKKSNASTMAPCQMSRTAFQEGEKIRYLAYYNWKFIWISAGICDFGVSNDTLNHQLCYRLQAIGRTYPSYDPFFKVRDTLTSYVDTTSLIPYQAHKNSHEGNWFGEDHFYFQPCDTAPGFDITTILKRKHGTYPSSYSHTHQCGFDIISSIYRLRNLPDSILFSDQPTIIPIRLDDGEYNIYLKYKGVHQIDLHRGDCHQARYFEMNVVEGTVFNEGDYLKLWISDDENRLPLLVEAPIRVGSVKAVFQKAENLAH